MQLQSIAIQLCRVSIGLTTPHCKGKRAQYPAGARFWFSPPGSFAWVFAMQAQLNRRSFLKSSTVSLAGFALLRPMARAIEPLARRGPARLQLSLAAYSFRQFFKGTSPAQPAAAGRQIDLFEFIDFCAEHGCDGTELTSYYFPKEPTGEFLLQLRRHAFLRGVAVSGTSVGNTFTLPPGPKRDEQIALVRKWVDYASIMTAPHIRIFAGSAPKDLSKAEARKLCIGAIEECAEYAGQKGVFLGLENHGGIVADVGDMLEIVRGVKSPWFGINLDTGNFHSEDPYQDLAACAPYAVNVQVKVEIQRRGQGKEESDLSRLTKILREANYQGYVALEYEAAPDPWTAVPAWLKRMKAAFAA
jgi:sugar phosphate isomerase/epimerase